MTTHETTARIPHVAATMRAKADFVERIAADTCCGHLTNALHLWADDLHRFARHVMGDIGEEQTEVEIVPLEIPEQSPAEAPAEPVPA